MTPTISISYQFRHEQQSLGLSPQRKHLKKKILTVSFSLSLADSSLDWDGVCDGVPAGVFPLECPFIDNSAISFFCFSIFFYNNDKSCENDARCMKEAMTTGHWPEMRFKNAKKKDKPHCS